MISRIISLIILFKPAVAKFPKGLRAENAGGKQDKDFCLKASVRSEHGAKVCRQPDLPEASGTAFQSLREQKPNCLHTAA